MKRKKVVRKAGKSKKLSNTKLMFLSIILLFIVFEALYILKSQTQQQVRQVAGVSIEK